jgi:hypothetical protein
MGVYGRLFFLGYDKKEIPGSGKTQEFLLYDAPRLYD